MKKLFVVTLLMVFAVLSVFAMPKDEAMTQINIMKSITQDGKLPVMESSKDAYAIAAGFKSILVLAGDFRGFAPTPLNSMQASKDGDTIQVISGKASGGDLTPWLGVFYTVSYDAGTTWSVPVLITSAGPFLRNYNEITVADGQYPYVIVNYRTADYIGDWFTTDQLGAGMGGWSSPALVTDTANYAAYMPSLAVNPAGDKVAMIAYDAPSGIGTNYSTDYGTTWSTYGLPATLNDSLWGPDVSVVRWGANDDVHAIVGMSWSDEVRYDIAATNAAFYESYAKSTNGGQTYSITSGIYNGDKRPAVPSLSGDTLVYYLDTLTGNGVADSIPVKAYLDEGTGFWADELGVIDGAEMGFGTWWYWWDAEYIPEAQTMFYAIPIADFWNDYYVEPSGDLYTFSWQGQSMVFGYKNDMDAEFSFDYLDLHDATVLNTSGMTATYRGNLFSANVAYDKTDASIYIVYQDYVDTVTGETSIEALKINEYTVTRATLSLNAASYTVECASYVADGGMLHVAISPGTLDSIYYKAIDLYDAGLVWDTVGTSGYTGISTERVFSKINNNMFVTPSFLKDNGSIAFTITENTNVNISLYDVTGRMVKTLANGSFTKGSHTINMNADDYKQGVYFVKINAGNTDLSRKVVVVK